MVMHCPCFKNTTVNYLQLNNNIASFSFHYSLVTKSYNVNCLYISLSRWFRAPPLSLLPLQSNRTSSGIGGWTRIPFMRMWKRWYGIPRAMPIPLYPKVELEHTLTLNHFLNPISKQSYQTHSSGAMPSMSIASYRRC